MYVDKVPSAINNGQKALPHSLSIINIRYVFGNVGKTGKVKCIQYALYSGSSK